MAKPEESQLNEHLKDLVYWERFALHLPEIRQSHIDTIKREVRDNIAGQKQALFDQWLRMCPNVSWKNVVEALEKVDEKTIAANLRAKFLEVEMPQMSPLVPEHQIVEEVQVTDNAVDKLYLQQKDVKCTVGGGAENDGLISAQDIEEQRMSKQPAVHKQQVIEEVEVKEDVVEELDKLHTSFLSLTKDVKCEIESGVEQGNMTTKSLVRHTEELRAFPIKALQSVKTTDDFFRAIMPHYNFLDCYLIVSLAMLLSSSIASRANEYSDKVKTFKKDTRVKCLKITLKRYYQLAKTHASNILVSITLEDAWGNQSMWLVEVLVKTLFPAKHPDEYQWFDVVPGSTVVKFLTVRHVTTLIVNSRKKLQFMRLVGVIGLQVGSICVLKKENENKLFTFENSLIQATVDNNIEAVQFLLEQVRVNVNVQTYQPIINTTPDELYETESILISLLKELHFTFTSLMKDIELELQNGVENEKITAATYGELQKSFQTTDEIFQTIETHYSFLNCHILDSLAPLLSDSLTQRANQYSPLLEAIKKEAKLADLHNPLEQYFSTQSSESIKVTMALAKAWRTCSMWFVEQLLQSIFSPTHLGVFQWFRVNITTESVGVVFLVPENVTTSLIENSTMKIEFMRLTGVTSLQIGEFHVYQEGMNHKDAYSFKEVVAQAKLLGEKEASHLLSQINQAPLATTCDITRDANKNFHIYPDPDSTALMIACCNDNTEMVKLLLDNNADPNVQNGRKYTALMYATRNTKIFQMLLDHNADINMVNSLYETVLVMACIVGNIKLVKTLLGNNRELMYVKDSRGTTLLHTACKWGNIQTVESLLQAQADPNILSNSGATPLHMASIDGHQQVVQRLLQAQADPNIPDNDGSTPLHVASYNGHQQVVQQLLQAKVDPNIPMTDGRTSLFIASGEGHQQVIDQLIQAQADPNIPDNNGDTPLHIASYNGHHQVVQQLLQASVDPNIRNNDGKTSLDLAIDSGHSHIVEIFRQALTNSTSS